MHWKKVHHREDDTVLWENLIILLEGGKLREGKVTLTWSLMKGGFCKVLKIFRKVLKFFYISKFLKFKENKNF